MAGRRNSGKKRGKNNRVLLYTLVCVLVCGIISAEGYLRRSEYPRPDEPWAGDTPALSQQDPFDAVFIDVGQGDCELIMSKGQTVLIDGGEKENGPSVVDKLHRMGVARLDIVLCTHDHSDHIGSLGYVVDNMDVGRVYLPPVKGTGGGYDRLAKAAAEKNIPILTGKPGDAFTVGDTVFTFLWPPPGREEKEMNNTSYVLNVKEEDITLLLTGDIEKSSEKELVKQGALQDVDVLKVAHHGSDTSSTQDFLEDCTPEYGMIEVGEGNTYHHPNMDVVQRLQGDGVRVFRTDVDGDIWVDVRDDRIVVQDLEDKLAA